MLEDSKSSKMSVSSQSPIEFFISFSEFEFPSAIDIQDAIKQARLSFSDTILPIFTPEKGGLTEISSSTNPYRIMKRKGDWHLLTFAFSVNPSWPNYFYFEATNKKQIRILTTFTELAAPSCPEFILETEKIKFLLNIVSFYLCRFPTSTARYREFLSQDTVSYTKDDSFEIEITALFSRNNLITSAQKKEIAQHIAEHSKVWRRATDSREEFLALLGRRPPFWNGCSS